MQMKEEKDQSKEGELGRIKVEMRNDIGIAVKTNN